MSAPFKQAEFDIMYGQGISREGSLLDVGVELGLIKKSGAWFTYEGEQLGQGRENAKQFMVETPELMIEINERIRSQLAPATAAVPAEATRGCCGERHRGRHGVGLIAARSRAATLPAARLRAVSSRWSSSPTW